ncbi:MAG: ABC transporter permease [Pseudomonadota bacterium]
MAAVPLAYSLRSLLARRLTTALTAGGLALVVFVFASVLMLAAGLRSTLVATGSADNVVVLRAGAETEIQSGLSRDQARIIISQPEIATGPDGRRLAARELMVLINLPKRGSNKPSNVSIRGVDPASLALRPQVKMTAGRFIRPGAAEVVVGNGIAKRFQHTGLGESLRFALRDWRVVGIFDAGSTGFGSEIWGDADLLMQSFRRNAYSAAICGLSDPGSFAGLRQRLEKDPRLTVEAHREVDFYTKQSELMANFIRILGLVLTIIFSFGATIGAMITMYAAVANRTREIGTLRALGFARRNILLAFLAEALLLSGLGAAAGLFAASFMRFLTVSTLNWQTFSELAFSFVLTPSIIIYSMLFALVMGLLGGALPALRAARMNIVESLRSV